MKPLANYFFNQTFHIFDQKIVTKKDYYTPFVLTDVFTMLSGKMQQPIIHFWQLDHSMVLGMKDIHTPFFDKGLETLLKHGYQPVIRNSGGLGIIADEGILNISLILPTSPSNKITIDAGYQLMVELIKLAFPAFAEKIQAYEISNSYCPGTFDLSINGKKFAGIAQRRVKDGIAVMAYLSVKGNQIKRGEQVKIFYQAALGAQFGTNGYPSVDPKVMENLSELVQLPLTIDTLKKKLIDSLSVDTNTLKQSMNATWFQKQSEKQQKKMILRNQILEEKEIF